MFGPAILNILAISRWVGFVATSPQGYYRSGYRYSDIDASKEGSYRTTGYLGGAYDGGYNGRSYGYGRNGDMCPYDNEKTFRKKRDVDETEVTEEDTKEVTKEVNVKGGILLERLKRHDAYYRDADARFADDRYYDRDRYRDDRYRDDRYRDDRYRDDGYRDDRYRYDSRYRDDQLYRDRYDDRYRDRYDSGYGGRSYGRDKCGREICNWEAKLECDLSKIGRGYGRSRYYGRIRWERENDAYYPRDKYRDLQEYFGTRMRRGSYDNTEDEEVLTITRVKPEDKGVYRCYIEDGNEEDFMEIHFFPKFPVDANAIDDRDC